MVVERAKPVKALKLVAKLRGLCLRIVCVVERAKPVKALKHLDDLVLTVRVNDRPVVERAKPVKALKPDAAQLIEEVDGFVVERAKPVKALKRHDTKPQYNNH